MVLSQVLKKKQEPNEFFAVLSHDIRTRVLMLLGERIELSYSEIVNELKIDDGQLNFHLRKLKGYVKLTERGTYILSPKGLLACQTVGEIGNYFEYQDPPTTSVESANGRQIGGMLVRRFSAFILDALVLFFCTGLFADANFWSLLVGVLDPNSSVAAIANLPYQIISNYSNIFFAAFIIFTVLETYTGQTLGKYVLKIRVEKAEGGKIELMDAATRNLGKVFLLPLDLLIGILTYRRTGYLRFFDYLTRSKTTQVP